jgi:hypothetical protein
MISSNSLMEIGFLDSLAVECSAENGFNYCHGEREFDGVICSHLLNQVTICTIDF